MDQSVTAAPVHKHVLVREHLRSVIATLKPGDPAPSERDLMQSFGVARMTVRQAIDALVAEGLLERIPARGTFVSHASRRANRPLSLTEEMERRGRVVTSETVFARLGHAGPGTARSLGITEGDPVIHWRRRRSSQARTLCVQDVWLNEVLLPGFLAAPLPESLYADLESRGLRPTRAEDRLAAELVTADESPVLGVEPGSPVLRHSRRGLAGDMVVEVLRASYVDPTFTWWSHLGPTS